MQIDYIYIKKILTEIRNRKSHTINTEELADILKANTDAEIDKLYGHLRLLYQHGHIEELVGNGKLGLTYDLNGIASSSDCLICMTGNGHAFLDMLNQNKILEAIKNVSLFTAVEIGKDLLQKLILEG